MLAAEEAAVVVQLDSPERFVLGEFVAIGNLDRVSPVGVRWLFTNAKIEDIFDTVSRALTRPLAGVELVYCLNGQHHEQNTHFQRSL